MTLLKTARVVVGVLSSLTLLALIFLNFLFPERVLTNREIIVLLLLISATLGLDMALKEMPININIGENGNKE